MLGNRRHMCQCPRMTLSSLLRLSDWVAQRSKCRLSSLRRGLDVGKVAVGKWAQYQKRGGAVTLGSLAPPAGQPIDWTIGTQTATTIPTTRVAAIPAGATQMLWRAIRNSDGAVVVPFNNSLTGLTTLTAYRVAAAWFNGSGIQVSDASPAAIVTTT